MNAAPSASTHKLAARTVRTPSAAQRAPNCHKFSATRTAKIKKAAWFIQLLGRTQSVRQWISKRCLWNPASIASLIRQSAAKSRPIRPATSHGIIHHWFGFFLSVCNFQRICLRNPAGLKSFEFSGRPATGTAFEKSQPAARGCGHARMIQENFSVKSNSNSRFGKTLADQAAQPLLVVRLITAAVDEPLHRVEQLEPVFQRRFRHALPLVKTLRAMKKTPFAADVLHIDLQLFAVLVDALPTDFSFGHFYFCDEWQVACDKILHLRVRRFFLVTCHSSLVT